MIRTNKAPAPAARYLPYEWRTYKPLGEEAS
ncbi:hypothetical protein QFZ77_002183 [Paenibacillus sp. V4I3]|nr:hypothetical protein [Paenibacillus sp. V4I3]MDQ0890545.1 hypothetical protein [Paenibacillus sp. V4I9]